MDGCLCEFVVRFMCVLHLRGGGEAPSGAPEASCMSRNAPMEASCISSLCAGIFSKTKTSSRQASHPTSEGGGCPKLTRINQYKAETKAHIKTTRDRDPWTEFPGNRQCRGGFGEARARGGRIWGWGGGGTPFPRNIRSLISFENVCAG